MNATVKFFKKLYQEKGYRDCDRFHYIMSAKGIDCNFYSKLFTSWSGNSGEEYIILQIDGKEHVEEFQNV